MGRPRESVPNCEPRMAEKFPPRSAPVGTVPSVVLDDGTAEIHSILILAIGRLLGVEEVASIQSIVSKEFPYSSVKLVGSRFRDDVDIGPRRDRKSRVSNVGLNVEFL